MLLISFKYLDSITMADCSGYCFVPGLMIDFVLLCSIYGFVSTGSRSLELGSDIFIIELFASSITGRIR
jgi:hypothetical protein